jgi:hypothetical protein
MAADVGFATDPTTTAARVARLRAYMDTHVLGPGGFVCASLADCRRSALVARDGRERPDRSFWAGQLSHVGAHYDLTEAGRPLRLLVIAMETGRADEGVTLEARRLQLAASAAKPYRSRNPHMRGTTQALRLALGREPGEDRAGELLTPPGAPAPVHLFEGYAMANLRLCSATVRGTSTSKGTRTMSRNCLRHLAATVGILQPTLCVVQGSRVGDDLAPLLGRREALTAHLARVELAGVETVLASFTHPSAQSAGQHWGRLNAPYLRDVVAPTLREARRVLASHRGP